MASTGSATTKKENAVAKLKKAVAKFVKTPAQHKKAVAELVEAPAQQFGFAKLHAFVSTGSTTAILGSTNALFQIPI